MDLGATLWAEVLTVLVAWLTVVCLLVARVPKLPGLLDPLPEDQDAEEHAPPPRQGD
ncbi:hypothetical protein [Paenarthrobacter ilicis]|uniref:hypothetical protein n=1 Tax=Paenarthrobacter ilicis TaxID=43665 RepID=UPI0028D60055|nr:hypothetical protein [Paenarthrobacter ilicis]